MMIVEVIKHSLMITSFVFIMMVVIEYLNVLSRGKWEETLLKHQWSQWILTSFLGITPGCLGAFATVSMYIHRVVTFGALTGAMIATSGDEAFVMLAMFPKQALLLFGILFLLGIGAGFVCDLIFKGHLTTTNRHLETYKPVHTDERCLPFDRHEILHQWKNCSPQRGWLTVFLAIFLGGIISGQFGPGEWNWIRITLLLSGFVGLFVVVSVPDHFLEEHLWKHIARVHIWRIFLWTTGALLIVEVLLSFTHTESIIHENQIPMLISACLLGIIPESGPHLIFVNLFAQGTIPFSILLASSISQDGHGMIPLLSHSRRAFVGVKAINVLLALAVGLLGYFMGW